MKPTAAGKKNILSTNRVCCITFTLYGASSSYFKFTVYLFEFMKGHRPTNPEADALFQQKRNRKGKGRSPRTVFFFHKVLQFYILFSKDEVEIRKNLKQQLFYASAILGRSFH